MNKNRQINKFIQLIMHLLIKQFVKHFNKSLNKLVLIRMIEIFNFLIIIQIFLKKKINHHLKFY